MKLQKALAVIGAGVILFAATDAISYAATGSSLVLGKLNQANAVTTIQNTGNGNALRLSTKSAATAPLVVNGKGKVANLYADRAATADNASKLGGQTITQVRTGINAATVGGKSVAQINAAATAHLSWGVVTGVGLQGSSPDVTLTHPSIGTWCVTIAGINLSQTNNAGATATPWFNLDSTSIGGTPATTAHVEVANGGTLLCPTGIEFLTFKVNEVDSSSDFVDGGFEFTIIH
jgi:hypothetical protein